LCANISEHCSIFIGGVSRKKSRILLLLGSLTAQTEAGMWVLLFWLKRIQFSQDLVICNSMNFPDAGHVRCVASTSVPSQVAACFACPVDPSVAVRGTREDKVTCCITGKV
jgi:hypothetical protein